MIEERERSGGFTERKAMIDREHDLPITRQAEVLRISRGSVYYLPRPVPEADLAIMRRLDRLHLKFPFSGARMLRGMLATEGCKIGRRHVKTLMRRMGIELSMRCAHLRRRRIPSRRSAWTSAKHVPLGLGLDRPNIDRPGGWGATPRRARFRGDSALET
jgi:putative transposase